MAAVSEVSICNLALTKMGADRITSLTDDNPEANAMNAVFASMRDLELRTHTWNFATERAQLSALSEAPTWGFARQFQLPSDCLRPLTIGDKWITSPMIGIYYRESVGGDVDESPYRIEGNRIHTDFTAPLNIRYTRQVTDPNEFDAAFVDALACRLAVETAADIIDANGQDVERLELMYRRSIMHARRVNAIEQPTRRRGPSRIVLSRY